MKLSLKYTSCLPVVTQSNVCLLLLKSWEYSYADHMFIKSGHPRYIAYRMSITFQLWRMRAMSWMLEECSYLSRVPRIVRLFCSSVTADDICQTVIKTGQKNLRFLRGMRGRVPYQTTLHHIKVGNALHSEENTDKFCSFTVIHRITYLLTELSPSWESANCAEIQKIPSYFKEPEGSSPCSQEPSTGLYPKPDGSSSYDHIQSL
jgi:hypothetical protein